MRNDGMIAGFIGLWFAIRGHVERRRRVLDRYFRINDIGVGRVALFFGSAAFWCFVLCIVSLVLLDIYMWTKAFDFFDTMCVSLMIATFVLSVLSWLMWGITYGSALPKIKRYPVKKDDFARYRKEVMERNKNLRL